MNYKETTEYLFTQVPMFERQGATGYKPGLDTTHKLDEHLGHPHRNFRSIHIAGTNGKGSCSHTIAALLQQCGYKVGLYTSPHLIDFRERIRINGKPISEEYVTDFVEKEKPFFEPLHPSFFEITTAMAFKYFSDMQVDIAVIEVGLGGRLDCTNIITPILSVITNISKDHTQLLGNTLAEIAAEKAGIIKEGIPVVIGEATEETRPVFEAKAKEKNAPIIFAEDEPQVLKATQLPEGGMIYHTRNLGVLTGELCGSYQAKNMNTIILANKVLMEKGYLCDIDFDRPSENYTFELKEAILHVCEMTGLQGRWQTVKNVPRVVCDCGHNVGAWTEISRQLESIECKQLHIVIGMVADKDVEGVASLLPKNALYYFTKPSCKRALDPHELRATASAHGINGATFDNVEEAYKAALHNAAHNDFVFVGGSCYLVADFLKNCI